jgi:hypothetical protein
MHKSHPTPNQSVAIASSSNHLHSLSIAMLAILAETQPPNLYSIASKYDNAMLQEARVCKNTTIFGMITQVTSNFLYYTLVLMLSRC